jgi:hypothetical protein
MIWRSENFLPYWDFDPSVIQPIASLCKNYATAAHDNGQIHFENIK